MLQLYHMRYVLVAFGGNAAKKRESVAGTRGGGAQKSSARQHQRNDQPEQMPLERSPTCPYNQNKLAQHAEACSIRA